jgi:hypothetical protein
VAELVAGETEHDELVGVLFRHLLVEAFEVGELRREAAFGGGVDDEDDFAGVLRERVGRAFFCEEDEDDRVSCGGGGTEGTEGGKGRRMEAYCPWA